jgi:hypothetical protein
MAHIHHRTAPVATVQLDLITRAAGRFCANEQPLPSGDVAGGGVTGLSRRRRISHESHSQSRVTHESRVSTTHTRVDYSPVRRGTCHTGRQVYLTYLGSYGRTGKGRKPIRPYTQRTEARSSSVARAHFHLNSPSQFVILQRKMRGASAALTSTSAHPRAWRGEGERKRARVARAVNKSFVSPLRVIAYV